MAALLWIPLSEKEDTRFLTLLPGAFDDPLTATLREGKTHRTAYEAVSYIWGLQEPEVPSIVNDCTVLLRRNLADCLRHLRSPTNSRCLWVDYLSISQDDVLEKQAQVRNIGRIFSRAKRVLAWLGLHENGSRLLFEEQPGLPPAKPTSDLLSRTENLSFNDQYARAEYDRRRAAIRSFLQRDYWGRTWIVQENVVAEDTQLVCERDTMSCKAFTKLLKLEPPGYECENGKAPSAMDQIGWYYSMLEYAQGSASEPHPLLHIDRVRGAYQRKGVFLENSMLKICDLFKKTQCSDPRDKAYALRFVAHTEIQPDYTKPVDHLFLDICADSLIHYFDSRSILEQTEAVQGTAISLALASDGSSRDWLPIYAGLCEHYFHEYYSCSTQLADSLTKLVGLLLHVEPGATEQSPSVIELVSELKRFNDDENSER